MQIKMKFNKAIHSAANMSIKPPVNDKLHRLWAKFHQQNNAKPTAYSQPVNLR